MIKSSIITVLFAFFLRAAPAQELVKRFQQYATSSFTEKLYMHTDKSDYLAGEILWWKLYYVDGYTHHAADLSKVVYVELLDNNGKPALQAKGALDSSGNDGSFYLPLTIQSGSYTLRAYTNWMKNFSMDYFFSKQINVVNPLRTAPVVLPENQVLYDAGFFPEGGDLVQELESRVAFRVTDQFGQGQKFSGVIISDQKDTVVQFKPLTKGLGHFSFTPKNGRSYRAVIRLANDQTIVRDLPPAKESGLVMHLESTPDGPVSVKVNSSKTSGEIALFVHTRQLFKLYRKARLENGAASFNLDRNALAEGISQFTIFDQENRAVAERLFFVYPKDQLQIEAGSDNREYEPRKKISLSVQSLLKKNALPASLSVSVYRLDSLQSAPDQDIHSYLWLGADLRGKVEDAGWYFKPDAIDRFVAMDNLMLTHGWRRFTWDQLKGDNMKIAYQPEFDGHLLNARVLDAASGTPVSGEQVFLGIPGTLTQFYPARTDSSGRVHFDARQNYGDNELVLLPDTSLKLLRKVEVVNPFAASATAQLFPLRVPPEKSADLSEASFAMQVQNVFSGDSLSNYKVPDLDSLPIYGNHGKIYKLDEYTRFTTMEEVLREYVLEVGIRQRNGSPHLMVLDFVNKGFLTQEPIILLDGVPVAHSTILAFDPLKVRKLQVLASRYIIGDFVYDGVVSFTTYRRTVEDLPANPLATVLPYDGLQLKREFFSPVYSSEAEISSRIPDYRTQLYWNPNILTSKTGTATAGFFASDVPGKYQIVWEGMDNFGHAGTKKYVIEIKAPAKP